MRKYRIILKGQPIGFVELENPSKHGDVIEYEGKRLFTYYSTKRAVFCGCNE